MLANILRFKIKLNYRLFLDKLIITWEALKII